MKLEEVNKRTKEAVDFLVAALESGYSEVLTAYLGSRKSTASLGRTPRIESQAIVFQERNVELVAAGSLWIP